MKSASFFCPLDSVIKLTVAILSKKGYIISNVDRNEGLIKAYRKRTFFNRIKNLDIIISRIDHHATRLKLMINENSRVFDRPLNTDEFEEERLIDSINRYF